MSRVMALIAGELLGFAIGDLARAWPWFFGATVGAGLVCCGWRERIRPLPWIFAAGFLLAARVNGLYRDTLENLVIQRSVAPPAALTVEDTCRVRVTKKGGRRADFPSRIGVVPIKVILPLRADAPPPEPGEIWSCKGALSFMTDPVPPGSRRTFWVRRPEDAFRLSRPRGLFSAAPYTRIRRRLSAYIGVGLSWCPWIADLNRAILLGERTSIPSAQRRIFETAGTIHVFAISGLHVVAVAQLLTGACAVLGIRSRAQGLVVLPLLAAYVMVTGARPSAIRAALMTACHAAAPLFGRKPDLRQAWIWTALIVYAVSPERIFDIGCTLSFAVMLGIALWLAWRERFRPVVGEGSPFADGLKRLGLSFRNRRRIAGFFNGLGVSGAAWIASVPIMAHFFNRVTYAGLVANIVVIVCSGLTVRFGLIGLLASGFCLPLAACFNNLSAATTRLMTLASEYAARLPFASCIMTDWHAGYTLAWYIVWGLFFKGLEHLLPAKRRIPTIWWKG